MSIALVVTGGYGNGTLIGGMAGVITRGYTIGIEIIVPDIYGSGTLMYSKDGYYYTLTTI